MFDDTIDELKKNPEKFDIRQIATITHSLGRMKISDKRFTNEIVNNHQRIAQEGEPQALSNIVWAFAKFGYKADALFNAVAAQHRRIVRDGKVQDLSNIVWAFAKVGHKAEELFASIAREHRRIAEAGEVQNLSNVAWAFATLGCKVGARVN